MIKHTEFLLVEVIGKEKLLTYHQTKDEWFGIPEVFDRQDVIDVRPPSFSYISSRAHLYFTGAASDRCGL